MVESAVRRAFVLSALGLAAMTACGGISERHVGDNESGSGGDDGTGGTSTGGRGGRGGNGVGGGVGANGGNSATGGSDDGGSTFTGGTGGTGGSVGGGTDGGTFTGGNGALGGTAGTVPIGGSPSGGTPSDYPIPWQWNGYIAPETNVFGVSGRFYFSTDCSTAAPDLQCTRGDAGLVGGDGQEGWSVSQSVACARGVAPQVTNDPGTGSPAYDRQWGALLGIMLYPPDQGVFDAQAHGVAGFRVDIAGIAPSDLRVNVVTRETMGNSHFVVLPVPSRDAPILFDEALQGAWVPNPVPLDTSRLIGIEFHVYTNASAPKPFDFCISNLRALTR
jgi:hypothetical protein